MPLFYKSILPSYKSPLKSTFKSILDLELFDFIMADLYISKYSLLQENILLGESYQFKLIKFGIIQFKSFLMYNYNLFSYNLFMNLNQLNSLKERSNKNHSFMNYIGFKIHCLGRFTRKQRASSY